jgi:hypothetical protein
VLKSLQEVFFDRWNHKKDIIFLLNALTSIKRNENETIDEFNVRFDKILQEIPDTHVPTAHTTLTYYLNSFQGMFSVLLNQTRPKTLAEAKSSVKTLDTNYEMSGRPKNLAPPRAKPEAKTKATTSTGSSYEIFALAERIKQLHLVVTQGQTVAQDNDFKVGKEFSRYTAAAE